MKIADIHAHIFPDKLAEKASHSIGDFYGVSIEREANMHCLTAEDRLAGVTRCVVSNSATSAKQVFNANTFLAEAVRGHAGYLAFGTIYPGMDGYEEELDRMLELGLRGIKIHPDFQKLAIDDESAIDTYKAIARRGLPVLFHMGDNRYDFSSPERLTNLLRRVPDLQVVAAHFGGWNIWPQSLAHPQPESVLYDTSSTLGMTDRDIVLRLIDKIGPDRLIFGTDFPMWSPKEELARFLALDLDESSRQKILYKNFMKLLKLHDEDEESTKRGDAHVSDRHWYRRDQRQDWPAERGAGALRRDFHPLPPHDGGGHGGADPRSRRPDAAGARRGAFGRGIARRGRPRQHRRGG